MTVILDARLKGKELEGVLQDADLKLLVVHQTLYSEVEEIFKSIAPIPVWIAGGTASAVSSNVCSAGGRGNGLAQLERLTTMP